MAEGSAKRSPTRDTRTICLPCTEEEYGPIVKDAKRFRSWLKETFDHHAELFPEGFAQGYVMKDQRTSKKMKLPQRRIELRNGDVFSIRPSFATPYWTGCTVDVHKPLLLRKWGVPYWALAQLFGRNSMYWYRLESSLGRNSIVGTTVRKTALPKHLLADEHHQTLKGAKVYIATTVAEGCCLGASVARSASTEDLQEAYGEFRQEAENVQPDYAPETVSTDGWKGTRAAWVLLFPKVVLLLCFLHAWLKIRDVGKHLGSVFFEVGEKVWNAFRAPNRRSFAQRLRGLRQWATKHLTGIVQEKTLDLCRKKALWTPAYDHPEGHRTSNMLDRVMRGMNRYLEAGLHLHGSKEAAQRHCRSWALLHNFAPWQPATAKANGKWRSPAERLNQHRYHECWLQNLLVSASLGGYRHRAPQKA